MSKNFQFWIKTIIIQGSNGFNGETTQTVKIIIYLLLLITFRLNLIKEILIYAIQYIWSVSRSSILRLETFTFWLVIMTWHSSYERLDYVSNMLFTFLRLSRSLSSCWYFHFLICSVHSTCLCLCEVCLYFISHYIKSGQPGARHRTFQMRTPVIQLLVHSLYLKSHPEKLPHLFTLWKRIFYLGRRYQRKA